MLAGGLPLTAARQARHALLALAGLALTLAAVPAAAEDRILCRTPPMCTLTYIETLAAAPFPYDGEDPTTGQAFFDTTDPETGQPAHTTADGAVYPRHPHYTDASVLFHVPPGFRPAAPVALVVFFHHHMTGLPGAVTQETQAIHQVNRSGRNAVLVAPQLARAAYDSAAGRLFQPGGLARLLDEAAERLARRIGVPAERLARAPVVLASYSGGYRALAYSLDRGGLGDRLAGALVIDGIFDQVELFRRHLAAPGRQSWFVTLYSEHSERRTEALATALAGSGVAVTGHWPGRLTPGVTAFARVPTPHRAVPLVGPPMHPLAAALAAWPP